MQPRGFVQWSGLAAMVAGIFYVAQGIVGLLAPQAPIFTRFSDYLIEIFFVLALVGTLIAIGGFHILQSGRERYGRVGVAGSLTAFIGFALMLLSALASTFAGGDVLGGTFFIGFVAAIVGLALLGAMTIRARVLPPWCGVALIVALPLSAILANFSSPSPKTSPRVSLCSHPGRPCARRIPQRSSPRSAAVTHRLQPLVQQQLVERPHVGIALLELYPRP